MRTCWTKLVLFVLVGLLTSVAWAAQQQGQPAHPNDQSTVTRQTQQNDSTDMEANPKQRLDKAAMIVKSMTSPAAEAGIPKPVFNNANCIAVVPGMVKGAIGVGASHGEGVATCRTQSGWSAPAFFQLTGLSLGPQIGGQKTDLILMVMNEDGMTGLMSGKLELGADASVAAGPVGREASASAGWKAAILSYSRSEGAFVGADISGAVVQVDDEAMNKFYEGKSVNFEQALKGTVQPPQSAQSFLDSIQQARQMATE